MVLNISTIQLSLSSVTIRFEVSLQMARSMLRSQRAVINLIRSNNLPSLISVDESLFCS